MQDKIYVINAVQICFDPTQPEIDKAVYLSETVGGAERLFTRGGLATEVTN